MPHQVPVQRSAEALERESDHLLALPGLVCTLLVSVVMTWAGPIAHANRESDGHWVFQSPSPLNPFITVFEHQDEWLAG
jgi:hypothetical protein